MSKKNLKIEPSVKIGGGSFNIEFVRSFKSKDKFVNDERLRSLVAFSKDIDDYLSSIWDKCHQEDELKSAKKVSEAINEAKEHPEVSAPEIKKVSTNKKATSKKE